MMNWAIYLTIIGVIVTAGVALHTLLAKKKDATIETLIEKNKWLEKQLESAEKNSSDILTDRLRKRISVFQTELERLSKDHEANESLIKAKEEEIRQMRELMASVAIEMGRQAGEFRDFKSNYVCPYCESGLTTLKDIEEEDFVGSLREYDCGYSEIDGATFLLCPCGPDYPRFEEVEVETRYSELREQWSCSYSAKTLKTWKLPQVLVFGKTKVDAIYRMNLMHEGKKERCPQEPKETPVNSLALR